MQDNRLVIDDEGHEIYYWLFGEGPEILTCPAGGLGKIFSANPA
jgi:hypothetical protein